jgi:hypothetical protein
MVPTERSSLTSLKIQWFQDEKEEGWTKKERKKKKKNQAK